MFGEEGIYNFKSFSIFYLLSIMNQIWKKENLKWKKELLSNVEEICLVNGFSIAKYLLVTVFSMTYLFV